MASKYHTSQPEPNHCRCSAMLANTEYTWLMHLNLCDKNQIIAHFLNYCMYSEGLYKQKTVAVWTDPENTPACDYMSFVPFKWKHLSSLTHFTVKTPDKNIINDQSMRCYIYKSTCQNWKWKWFDEDELVRIKYNLWIA